MATTQDLRGGSDRATHPWTRRHPGLSIGGALLAVVIAAIVLFLLFFDWDWLRGPIARYASARTGREVRIEGHLKVHLLTFTPTVRVGGLHIGNPAWAGPGDTASAQMLTISARLMPLFIGQLDLPLVELDQPRADLVRNAQDQANWTLTTTPSSKPAELPPIQRFIIRGGQITLKDAKRHLTLSGTVNASDQAGQGGSGFALVGKGSINQDPFLLQASGGPLIHVQRSKPYPFHLDLTAGQTRLKADGQLNKPFNLGDIVGEGSVSGRSLADLYPLAEVAFPGTPPYSLAAHFERQGQRIALTAIRGRVGDSDLEGDLSVDRPNGRRKVTGDLASRRLVFADLLASIGSGPKASAIKQTPNAPAPTPSGRLLPDAPLYKDRLREMDADVRYRAQSVNTGRWPLRQVVLHLILNEGVLSLDPIDFEFPQGRLAGTVRIDGSKAVPVTDLDVRMSNVSLQQFLPAKMANPPAVEGLLQARAVLHGRGDSIHKAAATADGRVVLAIPHGQMRQAFAELMGIDVANGLYLLLSKDNRQTDLRCAAAEFDVKGGIMQVSGATFDTGVVRVTGKGDIDLGSESLNLRLDGAPKKPRLLRLWAPILVQGSLLHPKLGVDPVKAAGQVGLAAAVGAVLAPLAAILPFIEPGLAKDADCAGLIDEAKARGAPVKASAAAPPPAPAKAG